MKLTKRGVLSGVGLVAVSGATVFGSGAFTQVNADRSFDITVAGDDESSQLVIETNSRTVEDAATGETGNGTFTVDASDVPPNATAAYGNFSDITDATTLNTGAFVIRNQNETDTDVDIRVGIGFDNDPDATIRVGLVPPSGNSGNTLTTSTSSSDPAEVTGVPSAVASGTSDADAEVACGFVVDSGTDTSLDATLSIEAERS